MCDQALLANAGCKAALKWQTCKAQGCTTLAYLPTLLPCVQTQRKNALANGHEAQQYFLQRRMSACTVHATQLGSELSVRRIQVHTANSRQNQCVFVAAREVGATKLEDYPLRQAWVVKSLCNPPAQQHSSSSCNQHANAATNSTR